MSRLLEHIAILDHFTDCSVWQAAARNAIADIVARLEPENAAAVQFGSSEQFYAEPRADTAEPEDFQEVLTGLTLEERERIRAESAEPVAAECDGWLAECEEKWATSCYGVRNTNRLVWAERYADRLIAAAKEREGLRENVRLTCLQAGLAVEQVKATEAERDELRKINKDAKWSIMAALNMESGGYETWPEIAQYVRDAQNRPMTDPVNEGHDVPTDATDWLAKCEREWRLYRTAPGRLGWTESYAERLLTAARDLDWYMAAYNRERDHNNHLERANASNLRGCDELKAQLEKATAEALAAAKERDELRKLVNRIASDISLSTCDLFAEGMTIQSMRRWFTDHIMHFNAAEDERDALRAQVAALETERDEARRTLGVASENCETLEAKLKGLTKERDGLQAFYAEHEGCDLLASTIYDLRGQVLALTKERDEVSRVLDLESDTRVRLEARNRALTKERDEATDESQAYRRAMLEHPNSDWLLATAKAFLHQHKPPRAKGPRSKPSEVRARIKREAWATYEMTNPVARSTSVGMRLDGICATGYAYCLPTDTFNWHDGVSIATRRAYEALESALKGPPHCIYDELVSEKGAATLWYWEREGDDK